MTKSTLQILNFVSLIAVIALNGLSNTGALGGSNVGAVSDKFPTSFTPAGFTFAIWGLIYLSLIVFSVYQARDLFSSQKISMPFLDQINFWFILSGLFNMVWLWAWVNEKIGLSMLLMLGILGSLLMIYLRLNVGVASVSSGVKWLVHAPFSLYLGWISVATIANFSILFTSQGISLGASEDTWALIMIVVAGLIGALLAWQRGDFVYAGVGLWAFYGIWSRQQALNPEGSVQIGVYIGAALLVLGIVLGQLRN
ncbi:MAG: tryptophan-rich sensory protein [Bacteroidota bacterium]